jgi:hypothetical protein
MLTRRLSWRDRGYCAIRASIGIAEGYAGCNYCEEQISTGKFDNPLLKVHSIVSKF